MRRLRQSGLGLLLLMSSAACGTFEISVYNAPVAAATAVLPEAATAQPEPAALDPSQMPLSLTSTSEAIRLKLLRSSDRWSTLWLDGVETRFEHGSESPSPEPTRHQIWVEQGGHAFRVLVGPADGPSLFVVSDGQQVTSVNLHSGDSQSYSLPPSFYAPYLPPEAVSDTITPHPMEQQLGSTFASLIFPAGLAQRRGQYEPVAMEWQAGRETLVVDWLITEHIRPSRYWIDSERGVILRAQDFGKQGGDTIESEWVVGSVLYDSAFGRELFTAEPSAMPAFADAQGHPERGSGGAGDHAAEPDPLGMVYFFLVDGRDRALPRLVRLPGSCVAALSTCPEAHTVATPFDGPFVLDESWWIWSPDGSQAAFVHQPSNASLLAELVVFEPAEDSWRWLARLPAIDLPTWSEDGQQIAFRVQDGLGRAMLYAVDRDGGGLRVLFEPEPAAGGVLAVEGWLGGEVLATTSLAGGSAVAYAIEGETAEARIAFEIAGARPQLIPSPDGRQLALATQLPDGGGSALQLVSPEGALLRRLGTFSGALYPIVWSPDGKRLAFYSYGAGEGDVSVIEPDGSDLRMVFSGEAINRLVFSPDGNHLLIGGGIEQRLFVVDLLSLETRLLKAPGLGLDTSWRLASWQPPVED